MLKRCDECVVKGVEMKRRSWPERHSLRNGLNLLFSSVAIDMQLQMVAELWQCLLSNSSELNALVRAGRVFAIQTAFWKRLAPQAALLDWVVPAAVAVGAVRCVVGCADERVAQTARRRAPLAGGVESCRHMHAHSSRRI
jgi:hypothetical protein